MSGNTSWNDTPEQAPSRPAKKPMSGCLLASLIIGGLGGVCLLACCGVGAYFAANFAPKITAVPAEVTAVGKSVLDLNISEDFTPVNSVTMDNFVFTMRIAEFAHKEGKGKLVLGAMKIKMGDPNQANAQTGQFRTQHETNMSDNLDVKKTESHEITIDGQKVSVMIGEANDRTSGKGVHTATADIKSPTGQIFFLLRLDDDVWDQDAVLKMFEEAKIPK